MPNSPLVTQRDFHVSALCVEDPSSPWTIDANPSTPSTPSSPSTPPNHQQLHRRHRSHHIDAIEAIGEATQLHPGHRLSNHASIFHRVPHFRSHLHRTQSSAHKDLISLCVLRRHEVVLVFVLSHRNPPLSEPSPSTSQSVNPSARSSLMLLLLWVNNL